jgi:hypothetical protein
MQTDNPHDPPEGDNGLEAAIALGPLESIAYAIENGRSELLAVLRTD